jgi:hypothetical protein
LRFTPHWRAALIVGFAAVAVGPVTRSLIAQPSSQSSPTRRAALLVDVGIVAATPFVEDGNGVTTRAGIGPFVAAGVRLPISERFALTAGVDGSTSTMRVASSGRTWDAGRTSRVTGRVGVEVSVMRQLALAGSVHASRLTGPDDVIPFRSGHGRISTWGTGGAIQLPVDRRLRLAAVVGFDLSRVGSQARENPSLASGWIGQARIGIRHAIR